MGCNCNCINEEKQNEMINYTIPPIIETQNAINKEKYSQKSSFYTKIDKDIEKPKLFKILSKKGNFLEKNISDIISEINPYINIFEFPNEIMSKVNNDNIIELPPIEFANGEIYGGGWNLQAEKEGYGIYLYKDKKIYKGLWKKNKFWKYGYLCEKNGNFYKGEFSEGKAKGNGEIYFKDKFKYTGQFDHGLPNGEGKLVNYENDTIYNGGLVNGNMEGYGVLEFKDGTKYEGEFKDGQYNGKGKIVYADQSEYEGGFVKNMKDGKGVYKWEDGKIYDGEFKRDIKSGKGKLILSKDKYYEGNWLNDKPHGKGVYSINGVLLPGIFRFGKIIITKHDN